jgi:hypothetical protein
MSNKLMEVYDKSYQATYEQLINKVADREEAKKVLGQIYLETSMKLKKNKNTIADIELAFEESKARHGV